MPRCQIVRPVGLADTCLHSLASTKPTPTLPPCSQCITLDKRLLIEGEGGLGESSIDQRANVPTFRIVR